jgi:hypothetical protein
MGRVEVSLETSQESCHVPKLHRVSDFAESVKRKKREVKEGKEVKG